MDAVLGLLFATISFLPLALLQGREDLRTDQRLMQVLSAADAALHTAAAGGGLGAGASGRDLAVHGFSVTPLGPRVGLIQWVDDSIPLYELYTAWHARQAERAALLASAGQQQQQRQAGAVLKAAAAEATKPLRPIEMFAAQLKVCLGGWLGGWERKGSFLCSTLLETSRPMLRHSILFTSSPADGTCT